MAETAGYTQEKFKSRPHSRVFPICTISSLRLCPTRVLMHKSTSKHSSQPATLAFKQMSTPQSKESRKPMSFSTTVKTMENCSSDTRTCHQCALKHLVVGLNLLFFKHLHKKTLVTLYYKYVVQLASACVPVTLH